MAVALFVLFLAVTIALFLIPGAALFGLLPLAAAVAIGIWMLLAVGSHMSLSQILRRTRRPELLGPGGPDDPERRRR